MTLSPSIDPTLYRQVLGQFVTGVTVISAIDRGEPVGMAVGSFSSVSLDPPLVAFFVAESSTSWPRIESAGAFCVSVLSEDQGEVCRRFATRGADKFSATAWEAGVTGAPRLAGALAWIECNLESTVEAGDHVCVMGRVCALEVGPGSGPLAFFRSGYGRFVGEGGGTPATG